MNKRFLVGLDGSVECAQTSDQEVAGLIPAGFGKFFSWRLIMEYFLLSFSPFHWQFGSCQFLTNEYSYARELVNRLEN